jgi:CRP-like cAMP-binding protein
MGKRLEARDIKDEAAAFELKGQWKKALEAYGTLEQLEPDEGAWPRHAGEMCRRLDRTEEAVEALSRAVKVYTRTGFVLKAVAVSKLVLELDPRQTAVQAQVATLHASLGFAARAPAPTPGRSPPPTAIALPPLPAVQLLAAPVQPVLLSAAVGLEEVSLSRMVPAARPSSHFQAANAANVYEIPLDEPGPAETAETARTALGRTPIFSSLDERRLRLLIERTRLRQLAKGQRLFKAGDAPDGLYVVASGEVAVSMAAGDDEVEVDRLGEGTFFGETALLTNQARGITVHATADSELLVIDRDAIGALLVDEPMVLLVLLRFMRDRMVKAIVETHRLFRPLTAADRVFLAGRFRFLEVEAGAVLVDQGKLAPGMFIILCGLVEAQQDGKTVVQLGPGRTFGDSSLLGHQAAPATMQALKKSFLLMLPLAAFQEVTLTHPQVLALMTPDAKEL